MADNESTGHGQNVKSAQISTTASKRILPRCANLADFDILEKVGEGTFGEVYKARQKKTGKLVALKKILSRAEQEGFPITAMREIKLLKHLKHPNVIDLLDMAIQYSGESVVGVYMVFVFMDHYLNGLLTNREAAFDLPQIKCYMLQLLRGVEFLHHRNILHRDIKGSNVLINNRGELRVTDFGLARPMEEDRSRYTPGVVTRWYRPPELLLGACEYDQSVDMWGVGCVLVEMLTRKSAFPGQGDFDQLELIARVCGTPTKENMPDWERYPLFQKVNLPMHRRTVREKFLGLEGDLIDKLLVLDPKQRLTATTALSHPFFTADPQPANPKDLPPYKSSHEYTTATAANKDPFEPMSAQSTSLPLRDRHHPPHPTPHRPTDSHHDTQTYHHHHRDDFLTRDDRRRHYRSRSRSPRRHHQHHHHYTTTMSNNRDNHERGGRDDRSHNPHGRQLSSYADMYDDDHNVESAHGERDRDRDKRSGERRR